ncbi:MAG: hypothetical protein HYV96_16380 [Opitutae bacterium]|nr:hypothetical protein [Opitutae bacterium]
MSEKQRFTVSLPEHIAAEVRSRSKSVGNKDAEYLAGIIRWWYGQGSPAISKEEERVANERHSTRRAS